MTWTCIVSKRFYERLARGPERRVDAARRRATSKALKIRRRRAARRPYYVAPPSCFPGLIALVHPKAAMTWSLYDASQPAIRTNHVDWDRAPPGCTWAHATPESIVQDILDVVDSLTNPPEIQ